VETTDMTDKKTTITPALRVLVVDDDPAIQALYKTYLVQRNCSCDIAKSGREALLLLMKQNFDVLIVDLRMENMDGMVFLQEALKIWPWLAVVISSGFITPEVTEKAGLLGITRILKKSEKMDILLQNVFDAADERREAVGSVVEDDAVRLMRAHMRMMTRLTQNHAETEVLVEELCQFGLMLSEILSADLFGVLMYRDDDEHDLLLLSRSPLNADFSSQITKEMITRFNVLAGRSVTLDDVNVKRKGVHTRQEAPAIPGKIVSVPLIMGSDISGVLTLATTATTAYTPAEISLFYHAANHVSALFMTLQEIHALAAHDALTGLFNRLRMNEELARTWELSSRYESAMGVIIIDLDHLKKVNDSYGHATGDDVLCEFAEILLGASRMSDIVSRYGGDEFVIILPRVQPRSVIVLAERILKHTRAHTFCEKSLKLSLTATIGIATTIGESQAESGEALLRRADEALYTAKRAGRDQFQVWEG
jgi:diguanylate cyclase (GGDEF)-like protein